MPHQEYFVMVLKHGVGDVRIKVAEDEIAVAVSPETRVPQIVAEEISVHWFEIAQFIWSPQFRVEGEGITDTCLHVGECLVMNVDVRRPIVIGMVVREN